VSAKTAALLLEGIGVLIVVGLLLWFGRGLLGFVQAPAQLDAALGNNAALAAGVTAQNAGTQARKADAEKRKAKSREAVKAAGKDNFDNAARAAAAPAEGASDYERAMNRIDRELGLQ
jgi:hypothetical protein